MARKVIKETEYILGNCPFCGKEVELEDVDEIEICIECEWNLRHIEEYERQKYLLGAIIVEMEPKCGYYDSDDHYRATGRFSSMTISATDGKRYHIEPERWTDEWGLEVNEVP